MLSLIWHSFHDAIKEGGGERIVRYWKLLLIIFKASNHRNYAKEAVLFLPAHASEQGNVIGSVRTKRKRTRDLNYLKFVATDFFPKTISPSAGETLVT